MMRKEASSLYESPYRRQSLSRKTHCFRTVLISKCLKQKTKSNHTGHCIFFFSCRFLCLIHWLSSTFYNDFDLISVWPGQVDIGNGLENLEGLLMSLVTLVRASLWSGYGTFRCCLGSWKEGMSVARNFWRREIEMISEHYCPCPTTLQPPPCPILPCPPTLGVILLISSEVDMYWLRVGM